MATALMCNNVADAPARELDGLFKAAGGASATRRNAS